MAGLGNKRKKQVKAEVAGIGVKPVENDVDPEATGAFTGLEMRIMDALEPGGKGLRELSAAVGVRPSVVGGRVQNLIKRQALVVRAGVYLLSHGSPHFKMMPEGAGTHGGLLDLIPVGDRMNLGHLSVRDKIQVTTAIYNKVLKRLLKMDTEADDFKRYVRWMNELSDNLRKWYTAENQINPGLSVDAVEILIPGINMPAIGVNGEMVSDAELRRRQKVVLDLISDAVEQGRIMAEGGADVK
jgi:hypothetical protein